MFLTQYNGRSQTIHHRSTIFDISSPIKLHYEAIHNDIPIWILDIIHKYMPGARNVELRRTMAYMNKILGEMVTNTQRDFREGHKDILAEKKDMMSMLGTILAFALDGAFAQIFRILVKASATGDQSRFLTDEEIVEQIVYDLFRLRFLYNYGYSIQLYYLRRAWHDCTLHDLDDVRNSEEAGSPGTHACGDLGNEGKCGRSR